MEISLPKLPKLTLSKLQALLLLGGAFVFAACLFCSQYRLVAEPGWGAFGDASAVITLYGNAPATMRFIEQLASSATGTADLTSLGPKSAVTFYVRPEEMGGEIITAGTYTGLGSHPKRLHLIRRNVQAVGFVRIDDRPQPFTASFENERAVFKVGRSYRGILQNPPSHDIRRLIRPISDQGIYLEKPAYAVWRGAPQAFQAQMQRFEALAEPWTWPGRVELSVSASSTGESLWPFVLYHRAQGIQAQMTDEIDEFAKNLLSQAAPQVISVHLPDDTKMQELRNVPDFIQKTEDQSRFGRLVTFTVPGKPWRIVVFHADIGESWVSNDISLISTSLINNIGAEMPKNACNNSSYQGFASLSGNLLPWLPSFKVTQVALQNTESGLFTICGYY